MNKRTYVWRDGKMGEKVPAKPGRYHLVQPDIAPFRSPVDNSVVGSRKARREHNARNGVVDIGNDRTIYDRNIKRNVEGYQGPSEREVVEHVKMNEELLRQHPLEYVMRMYEDG